MHELSILAMKNKIVIIFCIVFGLTYSKKYVREFGDNIDAIISRWNRLSQRGKLIISPEYSKGMIRPGQPTDTDMCDRVTSVPPELEFITHYKPRGIQYYQKYTHAYNIPIVSNSMVPDAALKRACYVVKFLLADREVLRRGFYRYFGRVGVIAYNQGTTSIPEYINWIDPEWSRKTRGLAGTLMVPISTGGEENVLCWKNRYDWYPNEDILLREVATGILEIAIRGGAIPGYMYRLEKAYRDIKYARVLWKDTYARVSMQEYFAEGVQSFFNVNGYSETPDGVHNNVNTRSKLKEYDPALYELIKEVFPCMNIIKDRCDKSSTAPSFRMDCDGGLRHLTDFQPGPRIKPIEVKGACKDLDSNCYHGSCDVPHLQRYIKDNCRWTCRLCEPSYCKDDPKYSKRCPSWAASGHCDNYRIQMSKYCIRTCRLC